jgi:hypothetical protein
MRPHFADQKTNSRLMAFTPRRLRATTLAFLAMMLLACSDPGSGGSGIPGGAVNSPVVAAPITGDAVNAPGLAPPIAGNPTTAMIDLLEANAVTIGGVRYVDTQVDVVLADGSAGNFAALKVDQTVVVSQVQTTSPNPRWKVAIQAP